MTKFSGSGVSASHSCSVSLLVCLFYTNSFIQGLHSATTNFAISNNCDFGLWPLVSGRESPNSSIPLQTGESQVFHAPYMWKGWIWGRTNCTGSDGNLTCTTGDCPNCGNDCSGEEATSPVTIVEFELNNPDSYGISFYHGYNLPVLVTPGDNSGGNCSNTGCLSDINGRALAPTSIF